MRWSLRPPPRYDAAIPLLTETTIPPEDPGEWRREVKKFRPRWRKIWDWFTHAGRMVSIVAGICSSTVGVHAALKALELKHLVEATIREEVEAKWVEAKALGRLETLESRMSGVPEWRGVTATLDQVQNQRLQELERRAANCEQQQAAFFSHLSKGR